MATFEVLTSSNVIGGSSYLVYTALLDQNGTNVAPINIRVLENTLIGVPVWSESAGNWILTLTDAFIGEVAVFVNCGAFVATEKLSNSAIRVTIYSETYTVDSAYWVDGSAIEIRVYP